MKKTIYKAFFASFATMCLATSGVFSQNIKPSVTLPPTPAGAALIKLIKYPIGYNTGSVNVSILLHEIIVGDIQIPITMTYNTKGLKSGELMRSFGAGWTLNAEPMVVHNVRGKPDVFGYRYYNDPYLDKYKRGGDFLFRLSDGQANIPDINPDEYYYKLLNNSGSFIRKYEISDQGTYKYKTATIPYDPIKISEPDDRECYLYNPISIIDDKGISYTFDVTEKSQVSSFQLNRVWKPSKISSAATSRSVTFTYTGVSDAVYQPDEYMIVEDVNSIYDSRATIGNSIQSQGLPLVVSKSGSGYIKWSPHYCSYVDGYNNTVYENHTTEHAIPASSESNIQLTLFDLKLVSTINSDQGVVQFIRIGDYGKLQRIKVFDLSGVLVKEIEFVYSVMNPYDNSIPFNIVYEAIDQVNIFDGSGNLIDRHQFEYWNRAGAHLSSINVNYWDYLVEGSTPYGYINAFDLDIYQHRILNGNAGYDLFRHNLGQGDREKPASACGVLKRITNHLGGFTEFEYEPDMYVKYYRDPLTHEITGDYKESGGLRIRYLTEIDPKTNSKYRKYFTYGSNEDGEGKIRMQIYPENCMSQQTRYLHNDGSNNPGNYSSENFDTRLRTYYSSPSVSSTFEGTPIVYDHVKEYRQSFLNGQWVDDMMTIYTYKYDYPTAGGDGGDCTCGVQHPGIRVDCHTNDSWMWGHLISRHEYKITHNTSKLLSHIENEYQVFGLRPSYIHNIFQRNICDAPYEETPLDASPPQKDKYYGYDVISSLFYDGGCVRKTSQTTYTYDESNNNRMQVNRQYTYNSDYYIKSTTTSTSGYVTTEELEYVKDVPTYDGVQKLIDKGMVNTIVSMATKYGTGLVDSVRLHYSSAMGIVPRIGAVYCNNNGYLKKEAHYYNYDQYGNPIYAVLNDIHNVVYLWGYKGQYLVAEIRNATASSVASALSMSVAALSASQFNNYTQLNALRSALPDALITTYEYRPLIGLISVTNTSARKVTYTYDGAGRLIKVADDKGKPVEAYEYNIHN